MPPSFLLDKTIAGMTGTIAEAEKSDGPLIGPLARKAATIPGDWTAQAARIVRAAIVPALERQLTELRAQRAVATDAAGMNSRPHRPERGGLGLRAGTAPLPSASDASARGGRRRADLPVQQDATLRQVSSHCIG